MIRNLGQVAAIYIGSSAPRNTNLIWLDNTVVPFVFRAYDGSAWSELATHKWVRAYVDGWLVTLPPRQLADDGDYMLINSNNVNYKITVKDFVKSAVGNPLDFKGVIRVSSDFPNPSTLESGDMYVIITSPAGGTVTDPYSGKVFEDSEKIVWDEVTKSWESLGKIDITVDLTTSYSETEVTIHSSAGKETTIQGATDQLAGVMLPGQYSWLQALSNGSIVPGDPSPLAPLTPAHKHNYSDIINRLVSQQETGTSTIDPMSQKATTDALNLKFDKASVLQVSGAATDKVMSQKAVTDALKTLSNDFNNKLTKYLPLSGGIMTGNIRFPIGNGIACSDVSGTAAYVVLRTWNANNATRMYVGTVNFPTYISSTASDLIHDRNGSSYLLWDSFNLPNPASSTDLAKYLPLTGGTLTGQLTILQGADIKLRLQSTDADNYCIIQALNSSGSQLGVFGYSGNKWAIGHGGTYYEIWDKYNLVRPVKYSLDNYNFPTFQGVDGVNFSYIKAGVNGILPNTLADLSSGGNGSCGTEGWSFKNGYFANIYTNKVTFGSAGPYITASTNAFKFLTSSGGVHKVAAGSLYVGVSYASDALALVPTNGIYSVGNIRTSGWISFTNNTWTDEGGAYKEEDGSLKVLNVPNDNSQPKPTTYGNVLQFNSKENHWCTQIWSDQINSTANPSNGKLRYRTTQSYATDTWNPWTVIATEDYVRSNYLPLTGGTLSATRSNVLVINSTGANETFIRIQRNGVEKGVVGYYDAMGTYLHNYVSSKYLFIADDGYARVGTTSGSTRIALITDIPAVVERTLGVNGTNWTFYAPTTSSTTSIYAPISAGTSGQILQSTGGTPKWVNASSVIGNYVSKSGDTMTGALIMSNRKNNVVIDVVGGSGTSWDQGAGALSVQIPSDSGQTPLILARRSGAAIDTKVATERLLSMELLDTGSSFIVGMSGAEALQLDLTSSTNKTGIGRLFGANIATENFVTSQNYYKKNSSNPVFTSGLLIDAKGLNSSWAREYVIGNAGTASSYIRYGGFGTNNTPTYAYIGIGSIDYNSPNTLKVYTDRVTFNNKNLATTDQIPSLSGYATQSWVNSQNFVKSTSTKKVTDIQPVDALPTTQAGGVLYLVFG